MVKCIASFQVQLVTSAKSQLDSDFSFFFSKPYRVLLKNLKVALPVCQETIVPSPHYRTFRSFQCRVYFMYTTLMNQYNYGYGYKENILDKDVNIAYSIQLVTR